MILTIIELAKKLSLPREEVRFLFSDGLVDNLASEGEEGPFRSYQFKPKDIVCFALLKEVRVKEEFPAEWCRFFIESAHSRLKQIEDKKPKSLVLMKGRTDGFHGVYWFWHWIEKEGSPRLRVPDGFNPALMVYDLSGFCAEVASRMKEHRYRFDIPNLEAFAVP